MDTWDDFEARYFDAQFAATTKLSLAEDVDAYLRCLPDGATVVDLLAGTGRVSLPLARAGHRVLAVDRSSAMLLRLRTKLADEPPTVSRLVETIQADVLDWSGPIHTDAVVIPFHGLNCLTDFRHQQALLRRCHHWLARGGVLALDIVNPLQLTTGGDQYPRSTPPRELENSDTTVTCSSLHSPVSALGVQVVSGHFEERSADGGTRYPFEFSWRHTTLAEVTLMLEGAGFARIQTFGGFRGEPVSRAALRYFVMATK